MQQATLQRLIADGVLLTSPLRARGRADVPLIRAAFGKRAGAPVRPHGEHPVRVLGESHTPQSSIDAWR